MSLMSLGVFWLQLPLFLGKLSSVMSSGVNLGPAVKNRTIPDTNQRTSLNG